MMVTLEEMKDYLRVDYGDDDALIEDSKQQRFATGSGGKPLIAFTYIKAPNLSF